EALIEGRNAWRLGVIGFWVRIKGIVATVFITAVTAGTPWWHPEPFEANFTVKSSYLFLVVTLGLGIFFSLGFIYLRVRSIRSLETKYYLHRLAHDVRDRQTELHRKLRDLGGYTQEQLHIDLESLLNEVVENVAAHFRLLTGDNSVCAAIRLARYDVEQQSIVYRTYARSKGLNPKRKKNSEDIPVSQGIPRYLREKNESRGILIYNDLDEAEKMGLFQKTKNDRDFPDDIRTLMVAPMNAWSGAEESMLGILYVSSRKKGVFGAILVDSMLFAADVTASAVANSFEFVRHAALVHKIPQKTA
ncbi:MAG TPA: hypothetical protein VFW93_03580, partial [Aquabacterium sp.]|uniref:hypothetical protein n=1 Tax=Aquabacterium sp. TaxID=1872578 RepID=UPI002E322613